MKRLALLLAIGGLVFVGGMSLHADSQPATKPTTRAAEECITVDVRFVTVAGSDVAKAGLTKELTPLGPAAVNALLRQIVGQHSSVVHAPRATFHYGENVNIADYTRLRFVSDYAIRKSIDEPLEITAPVCDTEDEGVSIVLHAEAADNGMIDLTTSITWQLLHGWKNQPAPSNKTMTVRVPDMHKVLFLRHMNLHSQETMACVLDSDPVLDEASSAGLDKASGVSPDLPAKLAPSTNPAKDDPTKLVLLIGTSKCYATHGLVPAD